MTHTAYSVLIVCLGDVKRDFRPEQSIIRKKHVITESQNG